MAQIEAVRPGATLARRVVPRPRSADLLGPYGPGEGRAIAVPSAIVDRHVDRAEPPMRQPIARRVARPAAAGSLG